MAIPQKPTSYINWNPATPANVIVPDASKQATGWAYLEEPPYQYQNAISQDDSKWKAFSNSVFYTSSQKFAVGGGHFTSAIGNEGYAFGNDCGVSSNFQSLSVLLGGTIGDNGVAFSLIGIGFGVGQSVNATNVNLIGIGQGSLGNAAFTVVSGGTAIAIGDAALANATMNMGTSGEAAIAIGPSALRESTGTVGLIGIGVNAGRNTTGFRLIAIGDQAAQYTDASRAVIIGALAGTNLGLGSVDLVGIGYNTLGGLSGATGISKITAVGASSATHLATAITEVDCFGYQAGRFRSGYRMTLLGANAGVCTSQISGTDDVLYIGQTIGKNATNVQKLAIGVTIGPGGIAPGQESSGVHQIMIGVGGVGYQASGARLIAMGKDAGQGVTAPDVISIGDYAGSYILNVAQPSGDVNIGANAGYLTANSNFRVGIGYYAGHYLDADEAVAVGYKAGWSDQGSVGTLVQGSGLVAMGTRAASIYGGAVGQTLSFFEGAVVIGLNAGSNQGGGTMALGKCIFLGESQGKNMVETVTNRKNRLSIGIGAGAGIITGYMQTTDSAFYRQLLTVRGGLQVKPMTTSQMGLLATYNAFTSAELHGAMVFNSDRNAYFFRANASIEDWYPMTSAPIFNDDADRDAFFTSSGTLVKGKMIYMVTGTSPAGTDKMQYFNGTSWVNM
jgi:hypothetical protein